VAGANETWWAAGTVSTHQPRDRLRPVHRLGGRAMTKATAAGPRPTERAHRQPVYFNKVDKGGHLTAHAATPI
jgi:poly(3-hydroxybutyrate) depolymerase